MQVGGVGGLEGHGGSHRVTGCTHEHEAAQKTQGAMRTANASPASDIASAAEAKEEEGLGMDMFRELFAVGKRLLGRIWGGDETGSGLTKAEDGADGAGSAGALQNPQNSATDAAMTAMRQSQSMLQNNPYFTPAGNPGTEKESVIQKIRITFQNMAGQLSKRFFGGFFGAFSGRNTLDSRRKQPKEDLRRQSRYREDGLEIDCVLTDDSYLMDSYNRKGGYSKLTTNGK